MINMRFLVVLLMSLLLGVVVNGAETCSDGTEGIEHDGACCPLECGECGGTGCTERPGGGYACCVGEILDSGLECGDGVDAPCVIVSEPGDGCGDGISGKSNGGDICCAEECHTCGGSGCGKFEGGADGCCTSTIEEAGVACGPDSEYQGPCIIGGDGTSSTEPSPSPPSPSPSNPSPTPIMTIPTSCELSTSPIRWSSSSGLNGRLIAEGGGCVTMTDLYNSPESDGAIHVLDENNDVVSNPVSFTGKWLLTSDLFTQDGATFYCRGTDLAGGDCDELRIQSTGPDDFNEIRGYGGSLYFEDTLVTSWDTPNGRVQEEYDGGRSFLRCVSEVSGICTNQPGMGECRMDVIDSEMAYMGYHFAESYGLTWKIRGYCEDGSNPEVFDEVNVYGDLQGSDIHHMYYGAYSYGQQGGVWTDNKMHDNHQYGFDPHDDSDYMIIARNEVYNNVNHGIIASKRCNNIQIYDNVVQDGASDIAIGIMLHRSSDNCEVYGNTVSNFQHAGIALMESFNCDVYDNVVDGARYGVRLSVGSGGNKVHKNTFKDITDAGIYCYAGSDDPYINDGRVANNEFSENSFTDASLGVQLVETDDISITGNVFSGTTELQFSDAKDTEWSGNSLPCGVSITITDGATFTEESPSACE